MVSNHRYTWLLPLVLCLLTACTISYKFNGASIDYTTTKSISINDFTNQALLVYPPLAQRFSEAVRDSYTRQTRLKVLKEGGDLRLAGEIVGYELTPLAAQSDGYASETKLTMTVNVRFENTKNEKENFEQRFSAYQTFPSTQMLEDVQDSLLEEIIKEITEGIFNKTVANW